MGKKGYENLLVGTLAVALWVAILLAIPWLILLCVKYLDFVSTFF